MSTHTIRVIVVTVLLFTGAVVCYTTAFILELRYVGQFMYSDTDLPAGMILAVTGYCLQHGRSIHAGLHHIISSSRHHLSR